MSDDFNDALIQELGNEVAFKQFGARDRHEELAGIGSSKVWIVQPMTR